MLESVQEYHKDSQSRIRGLKSARIPNNYLVNPKLHKAAMGLLDPGPLGKGQTSVI